MDRYERQVWDTLTRWSAEKPAAVTRLFGRAAGPASQAMQSLIPTEALRAALSGVLSASQRFSGYTSLLQRAGVSSLEELQDGPLQRCDKLADDVRRKAVALGGGTGAVFGVAGGAGLVADVPSLLTLAFRTIYRTGLCYGEALSGPNSRPIAIAIFALASANTMQEKQLALSALSHAQLWDQSDSAWRDGLERAAERELAKEAAVFSVNNVAKQLGRHLGWRKASGSLPVIGALVGSSVNAWYLYDVATVARYCFQRRWLDRRYPSLPAPGLAALAGPDA